MRSEELEKRVANLHRHVMEHPADYEAVIAELKTRSKLIDRIRKEEAEDRLKEVARIRRRRNEKQGQ